VPDKLVKDLASKDVEERIAAVRALGKLGPRRDAAPGHWPCATRRPRSAAGPAQALRFLKAGQQVRW